MRRDESPIADALEVARFLRIDGEHRDEAASVRAVLRLVRLHGLPAVKIGSTYRFHLPSIESWVIQRQGAVDSEAKS